MNRPLSGVIVDLDGTLAHMRDRGPFDYERAGEDEVDEVVRELVVKAAQDHTIVIVSGRMDTCYDLTASWLERHEVPFDDLLLRASGDYRPDEVVKREIFEQKIAPRLAIRYVLDDRDKVVRMWRALGLKCLQVADGDF